MGKIEQAIQACLTDHPQRGAEIALKVNRMADGMDSLSLVTANVVNTVCARHRTSWDLKRGIIKVPFGRGTAEVRTWAKRSR